MDAEQSIPSIKVDHLPTSPGIYMLRHRITGDTYVGQSLNVRNRVMAHASSLRREDFSNDRFARLLESHPFDFEAELLEIVEPEDCASAERRWIEDRRPTLNGHLTGAFREPLTNPLGRYWMRMDPEVKKRLDHLAVEAGAPSTEAYAGQLVAEAVSRMWPAYQSRIAHEKAPASPPSPSPGKPRKKPKT